MFCCLYLSLMWLEDPPGHPSPMDSQVMQYIQVLLILAGVLALAYVTLRVGLPRMFGMRNSSDGAIQVLARHSLEPKKTLYLVKTGSQVSLIGTSESQVSFLTTIAPESVQEVISSAAVAGSPRKDFRNFLGKFDKGRER